MKPEIGKFQTKVEISLGLGGGKCGIFSRARKIVARFFGNRKFKIGLFETVSDLSNLDKVVGFRKSPRFGVLTCVPKFQKL
jgi:hypothetical protein